MVINDFFQKTVFLDTAPLIYYIESRSTYQEKLIDLFKANDQGKFAFITSCITLIEVLAKPLKDEQIELADQYKKILTTSPGIAIFDVTNDISIKAAELKAKYGLRTPDAIQFATAIEYNADYFLTNDNRLRFLKEIQSIILTDL